MNKKISSKRLFKEDKEIILLNKDTIIILSGPPASGKSTFAKKYFKKEEIISSDELRKILGGSFKDKGILVPNQDISNKVFKLMEELLEERAKHGFFTVLDATNLNWNIINKWIKIAKNYNRDYLILFFDTDNETIKKWNQNRINKIHDKVIEGFLEKKEKFLNDEKFKKLKKIVKINPFKEYNFIFNPDSSRVDNINADNKKYLIVGDLHGDLEAFEYFVKLADEMMVDKIIFLGDVIDRGKNSLKLLLKIRDLKNEGKAILLLGNHEENLLKALKGESDSLSVSTSYTYNEIIKESEKDPKIFDKIREFLKNLPKGLILKYTNKKYFISHALIDIDPFSDKTYQYSDFSLIRDYPKFIEYNDKFFNNNSDYIIIHGHVNNKVDKFDKIDELNLKKIKEIVFKKNIYNLTDLHNNSWDENIYFSLLTEDDKEKIFYTITKNKFLIRYGMKKEEITNIYPSFYLINELDKFSKQFPKYLIKKRLGRYEIFKYSNKAFWDFQKKKFNFIRTPLMYARGHIFDYYTYSFVTVPFPKFFNLNETPRHSFNWISNNTIPESDYFIVTRKVNGFLVNISKSFDDKILISTSGSLEGDYVDIAKKNLRRFLGQDWEEKIANVLDRGVTIMTELVAPEDYLDHVVAKEEDFGFHLLAYSTDYYLKHPRDAKIFPLSSKLKDFDRNSAKITESLTKIGFIENNLELRKANIKNFEEELLKAIEIKDEEGVVIYFLRKGKIIDFLKLKYKGYLIKKAKKRSYLKALKIYEKMDIDYLKKNIYKDF